MGIALTLRPARDSSLQVKESPVTQPPVVATEYNLTTTNLVSAPTASAIAAVNLTTGQTVTATVVNGASSESGDIITFNISVLIIRNAYQVAITFTVGTTVYIRYLVINCKQAGVGS